MTEDRRAASKHAVSLERRESVSVSGVIDVISFDEETIVADTDMGVLILRGANLHVNRLNLDAGELAVDGDIVSLHYEESGFSKGKASFWGKLFK